MKVWRVRKFRRQDRKLDAPCDSKFFLNLIELPVTLESPPRGDIAKAPEENSESHSFD
jgi:hypothetical protein